MEQTGGMAWDAFLQNITQTVVSGYASAEEQRRQNEFALQSQKIGYLGQNGYYYEGQPGVKRPGTISTTTLLIGAAALVAVLLLVKS